ncbi:hypothetical protein GJ744_001749 [Endocarpon pusillum]|uniref:Chloride channel protein n=1 Tax=Endocarpon pusillum TaxID=364733 RepID=A0A8H7E1L5_9EURO|nr:hypothetical protein GJ744_001749 [Endocarpon pusillum]
MSSLRGGFQRPGESSITSPRAKGADESDNGDNPVAVDARQDALLETHAQGDLGGGLAAPISFKRNSKHQPRFSLSNLLPNSSSNSPERVSSSPQFLRGRARDLREQGSRNGSSTNLGHIRTPASGNWTGTKEGAALDWYVEGPGRRVGYDDLTTIDWIFEYTKERQRLRVLHANTSGLMGYARRLLDASHVWLVLIVTGVTVGVLAASIDTVSLWLGDIKSGYCRHSAEGGRFYLHRGFCCWGHDDPSHCQDWTTWREALHIPSQGGAYTVEYIFFVLYSVLFAACAAFLVKSYAIYARHSGIPEIKTVLGGFVIRRFLGLWTLVIKSLGLCLAVASGLWLGKEGPLVHVACCCANLIMKPIDTLKNNEARKREVLSAAAASGISVAFGSPIGGVLFSLEQLSYYFPDKTMWQSFVCAMVAAVTLQAINPFRTGKIVLYQVEYSSGWHGFEMVPFALLGITGGVYGGLFIKLNMLVAKFRKSTANPLRDFPVLEVLFVSVLTAVTNYPNTMMRGQNSELVHSLFSECDKLGTDDIFGLCKATTAGTISMVSLLLTASGLGSLLTTITFGLQIPAGVILPSLAIGALYGRALGVVVDLFQKHHPDFLIFSACEPDIPCITPGTYAIVGAASALAGVTRMTVSIVVIMFELTGALTYVLPIMIAVMLSKWIGDAFSKRGIYDSWIQFNGYPYIDNKDDTPAPDVTVSNIMTQVEEMVCIDAKHDHTIESLRILLNTTTFRGFPVIISTSASSNPATSNLLSPLDMPERTCTPFTTSKSTTATPPNTLLGYISRTELTFALNLASTTTSTNDPSSMPTTPSISRNLPPSTPCLFTHSALASPLQPLISVPGWTKPL